MAPTRGLLLSRGCTWRRLAPTWQSFPLRLRRTYKKESEALREKGGSPKYIAKLEAAEESWDKRALQIQRGEVQNVWDLLEERGFVKDVAGYALPFPRYPCLIAL